jgi:hypothetical protein
LLRDRSLSIADVAFFLEYSEPAAFTRSFRRWTGQTTTCDPSGACVANVSALEEWRPTLPPNRIIVVIRRTRDVAEAYAKQYADAGGAPWYADADAQGARALGVQHEPALVAIESGRVAWTVTAS